MLTIKNWPWKKSIFFLLAVALVAGCTPPGPRALLKGKRLIETGNYSQAIERLTFATRLMPTNAQAWNYLGLACHYAGASSNAQNAYLAALKCDPDLTEVHFNLGCLWLETRHLDGARNEFTTYTLRRPNNADGFVKLGTVEMLEARSRTVTARMRDLDASEKNFNEALRLASQYPEALNGLGLVRLQRGHSVEAAQCFNAAVHQQATYAPAVLNLAVVYQQNLHDARAALQKYREYAALKPPPEEATALGAVVRQLEQELNPSARPSVQPPASQLALSRPESRSPQNLTPRKTDAAPTVTTPKPLPQSESPHVTGSETVNVASDPVFKIGQDISSSSGSQPASDTAGSGVPSGARYPYRSLSKPTPGNRSEAQRAFDAGVQAQTARRLGDAVQDYQRATHLDGTFYEAYFNLALAFTMSGNLRSALNAYENALAVRADSADARYNFALALQQSNYPLDAANELDTLLRQHPTETRAHLALANLCAQQLHDSARARQHYLKVLETDPRNPQAGQIRSWLASNP